VRSSTASFGQLRAKLLFPKRSSEELNCRDAASLTAGGAKVRAPTRAFRPASAGQRPFAVAGGSGGGAERDPVKENVGACCGEGDGTVETQHCARAGADPCAVR
jgi:hypothetical protein